MRIDAGGSEGINQDLVYRKNIITESFQQDCGGQTLTIISQVKPSPLEVNIVSTGKLSPYGKTFQD